MRFWINFIEKFGKPTIIATVGNPLSEELPPDEELQKHLVQLQKMQEQNTIVTAGNIKIELHDNNKSGNVELYKELINICNAEISKAILSQTLTTEIDGGSFAAAKTHLEIRNEVVHSDMELVEKSMNEIISNICTLNFGHIAAPKFCFEK
jgi:phage gp29-like protein